MHAVYDLQPLQVQNEYDFQHKATFFTPKIFDTNSVFSKHIHLQATIENIQL